MENKKRESSSCGQYDEKNWNLQENNYTEGSFFTNNIFSSHWKASKYDTNHNSYNLGESSEKHLSCISAKSILDNTTSFKIHMIIEITVKWLFALLEGHRLGNIVFV